MTFNNRIVRTKDKIGSGYSYFIKEVYYDKNGEIEGWTRDGMILVGENVKHLWENILFRLGAFKAPVLEEKTIKGKEKLVEVKK